MNVTCFLFEFLRGIFYFVFIPDDLTSGLRFVDEISELKQVIVKIVF